MTRAELAARTRRFALEVIRLASGMPRRPEYVVIGRQLLRSATSVGANYRSACRARSRKDFIARIGVVEEEADETMYWLELLRELAPQASVGLGKLYDEARQLTAIFTASRKTAKSNQK